MTSRGPAAAPGGTGTGRAGAAQAGHPGAAACPDSNLPAPARPVEPPPSPKAPRLRSACSSLGHPPGVPRGVVSQPHSALALWWGKVLKWGREMTPRPQVGQRDDTSATREDHTFNVRIEGFLEEVGLPVIDSANTPECSVPGAQARRSAAVMSPPGGATQPGGGVPISPGEP